MYIYIYISPFFSIELNKSQDFLNGKLQIWEWCQFDTFFFIAIGLYTVGTTNKSFEWTMGAYPNHFNWSLFPKNTPLKTNMSPKKGAISKKGVVLQTLFFRGHVRFRGGTHNASWAMAEFLHHDSLDFHHDFHDFPKDNHYHHGAILQQFGSCSPWVKTMNKKKHGANEAIAIPSYFLASCLLSGGSSWWLKPMLTSLNSLVCFQSTTLFKYEEPQQDMFYTIDRHPKQTATFSIGNVDPISDSLLNEIS